MKVRSILKGRIGYRLLGFILLFILLAVPSLTAFRVFLAYRQEVHALEENLDRIDRSVLPSLTQAAWVSDTEQIETQLKGILTTPDVRFAEVREPDGTVLAAAGAMPSRRALVRRYPLVHPHGGRNVAVGTLTVAAGFDEVLRRLLRGLPGALLTGGMAVVLGSGLFLVAFHLLVTRHLAAIAAYVRGLDPRRAGPLLALKRKPREARDELDEVAGAINGLQQELRGAYADIARARDQLEREVTQLKEAQAALGESEARYRTLFESTLSPILVIDAKGNYVDANPAGLRFVECTREELLTKNFRDFTLPDADAKILKDRQRLWRSGGTFETDFFVQGQTRTLELAISPITLRGSPAVLGIGLDITRRKKMEQELLKVKQLESLGILAGGIAHDFNNLLQGILGNISLARLYARPEDSVSGFLERAEQAHTRAAELTRRLITFSQGGEPIKKATAIGDLLRNTVTATLEGSRTTRRFQIPPGLKLVEVDEGQMAQAFHQIVLNAREAMPDGGNLEVTAEQVLLPGDEEVPLPPGEYVRIAIRDTGVGIPAENMEKIFEPYWTTKEMGATKGTGLGLTISYSIVRRHGGAITVSSARGAGTVFRIYLPVARTSKPPELAEGRAIRGRVLILDDEAIVADVAKHYLTHLGYAVAVAREGEEAADLLRKAKEARAGFDAVVVGLTLPGELEGARAAKRLREIDPEVRIVASTGYADDPILTEYARCGFQGALAKPYKIEALGEMLARMLETPSKDAPAQKGASAG